LPPVRVSLRAILFFIFFQDKTKLCFQINGRDVGFQTTKEGEFWRVLLPGIYTIELFAEGYHPKEVQFAVIEQNPTLLNITLQSVNQQNRRRSDQEQ
jgi:hypothetical protein